jgi:hypothetical protein
MNVAVIRHFIICETCYAFERGLSIAANQCGSHIPSSWSSGRIVWRRFASPELKVLPARYIYH